VTKIIPTRLRWDVHNELYLTSLEDLESKFDQLEQEARDDQFPFVVEVLLEDGHGEGLYVMVGYDYSILQYYSSVTQRVIRSARGNPEDESINVPFSFMGSYSEPPRSLMIPSEQAYAALKDFVLYKRVPEGIKFE